MSDKYDKWLASYERPETRARNAKLEEKIKKTDLYWENELEKIMSQIDVVKFKEAFKKILEKTKHEEMTRFLHTFESGMEKT